MYTDLISRLESGFLGFWVRQYRISYLIVLGLIVLGVGAAIAIPKESSPSIEFGIVSIGTAYPGTNPIDMDSLVSNKIYKEIKDIKGIDKIQSSSSLGFSSVVVTLKTSANTKDVLSEIRNNVNRVSLPADAKTPVITEINSNANLAFSTFIYSRDTSMPEAVLRAHAQSIKTQIEAVPGIEKVEFDGKNTYDLEIVVPREKLEYLRISLDTIAATIRSSSRDVPIGNFAVGERKYDFRIEGKEKLGLGYMSIPIPLPGGTYVPLGDIATIERIYKDESKKYITPQTGTGGRYVSLTISKNDGVNIFAVSDTAKKIIVDYVSRPENTILGYVYSMDLADNIRDDYAELAKEAVTTLILVFIAMFIFVGFWDSLFATLTLPLAFLSTFILLNFFGYSLNFLTNFSLILSFGIAIDTIIVIVQGASAKLRVGYHPRTAIMLSLREYAVPIISGVLTTIVVFIPMMTLPGVLGKFLAYIPITIFGVLATGLVLALTVNSALYILMMKKRDTYIDDENALEYADADAKSILETERIGKTYISGGNSGLRLRAIHAVTTWYKNILRKFLESTYLRRISIFLPFVFFLVGILFIAPRVGFDLFPGDDQGFFSIKIVGPVGIKTDILDKSLSGVTDIAKKYPEIQYIASKTVGNTKSLSVQLTKKIVREMQGQRSVFEIEKLVLADLQPYTSIGYAVETVIQQNGPPGQKAIGIKLISDSPNNLPELIRTAKIYEKYLKTIPGTKNVGLSSEDTPGQFIFTMKRDILAQYGISPAQIYSTMSQAMNGVNVGSLEDTGEDMSILLRTSQFRKDVNLEDILALPIQMGPATYTIGQMVEYRPENAIAKVSRTDGKVQISVEADVNDGVEKTTIQRGLEDYVAQQALPTGISYSVGGENEANAALITAVGTAFFLSILAIFAILVLQFNSFSQPAVILYSVVMALPFVMIGLILTDNKFSLPFGIGFIAFTGIAVNHGIILIYAINENLQKGMQGVTALIEAGSSRLEPMMLTTLTTVLGILPIALRDKFWSGMGFTIVFGIMAATVLTLFVVKGIYYELYVDTSPSFVRRFFRWIWQKVSGIWKKRR